MVKPALGKPDTGTESQARSLFKRPKWKYTHYTTYRNRTSLQHEWNILHEELVQLHQCREQLNQQLISYHSIPLLPDIVDSTSPKFVVSAEPLPLSCRPYRQPTSHLPCQTVVYNLETSYRRPPQPHRQYQPRERSPAILPRLGRGSRRQTLGR